MDVILERDILGTTVRVTIKELAESVFINKRLPSTKLFDSFNTSGYLGNVEAERTPWVGIVSNTGIGQEAIRYGYGDLFGLTGDRYLNWQMGYMWLNNGSTGVAQSDNVYQRLAGWEQPGFNIFVNSNAPLLQLTNPTNITLYNIMYFETREKQDAFINGYRQGNIDTTLIMNYPNERQEDFETSKQYWFYNTVSTYLKDPSGHYTIKQGTKYTRVNFSETDKRLYFTATNSITANYVLKNYSGVECEYSTDGKTWTNVGSMPSSLEGIVKGNLKVGGAVHVGTFSTNIPIFGNNQKGEEYENGNIEVDEADNVDTLSKDDYSPVTPIIKAGDTETQTVLGSGVAMDKMTMFYKMTGSQLANFGATLFNSENADNVIAGTKLLGSDALNSIVGLRYYPFDISKVATTTGTYYVKLGGWDSGCASSGVITSNNGIIDMGSTVIEPPFKSFLDFQNVGLSIYLPYVGTRDIDVKNVFDKNGSGKTLSVKYAVDITTGKCKAMLFANGLMFDSHDGIIARDCPISGVDAQSYNTANRQTQMNMTNANISGKTALLSMGQSSAQVGTNPFGVASNLMGGVGSALSFSATYGDRMAQATQDVVNAKTNLPTYFSGTSGGQLGELEPQYVYLIFSINKTHMPANELEIVGKPSNNSGTISQFYGFLSCDMVKLESLCTNVEKTMIQNLLSNGIYI